MASSRHPHPSRQSAHAIRGSTPPAFQIRALALAIGCALAGLTTTALLSPGAALAAEPAASQAYAIPAGRLSDVLARFAATAGVQLVFDPQMLAGLNSPGLQGRYTVREGFTRLLAGSGHELVETGNDGYALRRQTQARAAQPAPTEREATLPAVNVTARSVSDGTTEGTGSYTTSSTSTATKLNLSPRETPQTVTVVTRQQMDDFGLTSVDNVLESTSGVVLSQRGADGSLYYSRSFALQTQYDGMMNPIGIGEGNRNPSPDSAFLDRVEILQGATGLLSGAGEPGGTVNLVRKRPTESFKAHAEAQLGAWATASREKRPVAGAHRHPAGLGLDAGPGVQAPPAVTRRLTPAAPPGRAPRPRRCAPW